MRLFELGELGLLAELERRGLARNIGDDAAQFREGLVVTQDALVERVHFRLNWISWRDLGWRVASDHVREPEASGAELNDLGFGEDYELLAAVGTRVGYATIGHCEEGEGVAVTLNGEPYELSGWQHFR
jgi:thiamine monophosphate kinase